ncbi:O-antigen ligase family protein [Paracoccus sp. (in: a-proteobacteria)]|uniref:O-antigen ligase family protein n=1 Tax=Paracoccus sp. TaxID=267 RepID=UPI0035B38070
MTALAPSRPGRLQIRWRTLECWAVGAALFFQSGAVSVLLFSGPDGDLTAGGRRMMQLLVLPVYLVTLLLAARHPRQILAAVRGNLAVAVLLALPFASVLWSVSPTLTLRRAVGLLLSILLSYVIAVRFTPRQFMVLLVAVLGTSMVLSLGLALASPGLAFMPPGHEATGMRGIFHHKNVLGWNAAIAAITAGALAADRSLGLRFLAVLVFAAAVACLLLSGSATALVMMASGVFFVAFYMALARSRPVGKALLILTTVQVVALVVLSIDVLLGMLLDSTAKDVTLTGRVPLWNLVDEAISRRFLLGYGYQAFWTEGSGEAWNIWTLVGWMTPHAHNGFRDSMLSFGAAGTILLLAVIARALRSAAFLQCRYPKEGWLWLNVLICIFLVMNLTESMLLIQNNLFFILFMAAVIMASARRPDS